MQGDIQEKSRNFKHAFRFEAQLSSLRKVLSSSHAAAFSDPLCAKLSSRASSYR